MTEEDLLHIEVSLRIQLPDAYKHRMQSYPIPLLAGNKDRELWDNADALIKLNQELRQGMSGGVKPWPAHLFSLGLDHGGCTMAMDLNTSEPLVWWVDRCHLENAKGYEKVIFDDWVIEFVRDMSSDLTEDGFDPTASPEALNAHAKGSLWPHLAVSMGCLLMFCSMLLGLAWLMKWLKKMVF